MSKKEFLKGLAERQSVKALGCGTSKTKNTKGPIPI